MNIKELRSTIFHSQPCKKRIGRIESEGCIQSLLSGSAISGRSFKVQATTGVYKIRVYDDTAVAKRIERYVLSCRSFMPPFVGRDGTFLVFSWLEGESLNKRTITLNDADAIGELYGKCHSQTPPYWVKVGRRVRGQTASHRILRILELFEESYVQDPAISNKQHYLIKMQMLKFVSILKKDMVIECADSTLSNFLRTEDGMYYVDEDGLRFDIKGIAIPEIFKHTSKVFHAKFLEGYGKYHNTKYLTPDYLEGLEYFYVLMKYDYCLRLYGPVATRTSLFRSKLLQGIDGKLLIAPLGHCSAPCI